MYAKVANQLLQGKKVTIEYTTIDKLLDKPAEKSDVYEKLQEISGEIKTLNAKLDGRNIILMFERKNRARNQDGTFKKDVWWTPWSDSWEYKMSEDLKDMLERTLWTFIEAFLGALVVAPLVSLDANTLD